MRAVLAAVLVACSSPPRVIATPAPPPATPAPAVQVPDPAPPAFRLPGDVRPVLYALDFTIIPEQTTASGKLHVDADVMRATRVVWLNATGLSIDHAELAGGPARVIAGNDDFIGLAADRELPAGPIAIDIAFAAPIDREKSRAIYAVDDSGEPYVYTFFEPTDARRAFPCFDEPGFKVPWQLTFHVRRDHVALGNAPIVRETDEPGGMKRVELAETKPLPSYLVAFVVGPFELVDGGTTGKAGTPIRFIIPKGRGGELGYAKQVTPKVVSALEDYFGIAYPYRKLDVAVVPRFWGTMEHPGIVAMGQPLTLIRPEQETRARKQAYTNTLAHELSHYWFGDYVTPAWWDDTWLNEALGEWSDVNITEAAEPTWRYRDDRVGMSVGAMTSDETLSTQAIRQPVTTREGIQASFDGAITYLKGASVLRMFEAFVGHDRWQAFLRTYLADHAWGNASADDFLRAIRLDLGASIEAGFKSFLEQPGVPRIRATIQCQAQRIALEQTRSLPAGVTDPQPKLWHVPVCVRYGDAAAAHGACTELAERTGSIAITGCPTWVLPNADAVGYYRSAIDPATARALLTPASAIARAAKPTPAERMMIVADLTAAVARDELALDKLLELVPVIAADPDDKVARSALEAASVRADALDEPMYQAWKRWWAKAFGARARQLGWRRGAKDSDDLQRLRQAIVPVIARDDKALAADAAKLADRWLAERTGIDDDLVAAALRVAAYGGDAARFDRYLAAARTARDRTEHGRILGALGGFIDPALAQRALETLLDGTLDLRDTLGIVHGVLRHRETRDLGIAFVTAHLDNLLARMRDDEAAGFLGSLAGTFCDADRRAKIAALVTPRAEKVDGAHAQVKRGLEESDQCIALLNRQLPALHRVLHMP